MKFFKTILRGLDIGGGTGTLNIRSVFFTPQILSFVLIPDTPFEMENT